MGSSESQEDFDSQHPYLINAAQSGDMQDFHTAIAKRMDASKSPINYNAYHPKTGMTLLMVACYHDRTDIIDYLIDLEKKQPNTIFFTMTEKNNKSTALDHCHEVSTFSRLWKLCGFKLNKETINGLNGDDNEIVEFVVLNYDMKELSYTEIIQLINVIIVRTNWSKSGRLAKKLWVKYLMNNIRQLSVTNIVDLLVKIGSYAISLKENTLGKYYGLLYGDIVSTIREQRFDADKLLYVIDALVHNK
jgi:hypothetical protein